MASENYRISETSWKTMKGIISPQSEKNNTSLPPEYGYVTDNLRDKYNIYVFIYPKTEMGLDNVTNDLIFEWVGNFYEISKNKIIYKYTVSGNNYIEVIRNTIDKAVEYIRTK